MMARELTLWWALRPSPQTILQLFNTTFFSFTGHFSSSFLSLMKPVSNIQEGFVYTKHSSHFKWKKRSIILARKSSARAPEARSRLPKWHVRSNEAAVCSNAAAISKGFIEVEQRKLGAKSLVESKFSGRKMGEWSEGKAEASATASNVIW